MNDKKFLDQKGTKDFFGQVLNILDITTDTVQESLENIQSNLAEYESSPATSVHAQGTFLSYQDNLYRVISPIAIGDSLTIGANIQQITADEYFKAIDSNPTSGSNNLVSSGGVKTYVDGVASNINADLANKADDSVVVKSVNGNLPTNGAVEVTAEDIPADGIGDKSVSGNPITIEDGMASVAKGLSVTLEPMQDLHGYESPWIGTDVDKQPYLFRAISDSSVQDKGTHELDKLIGGTVAWNQILKENSRTDRGITSQCSNGVWSFSGTASSFFFNLGSSYPSVGHKVLNTFKVLTNPNNIPNISFGFGNAITGYIGSDRASMCITNGTASYVVQTNTSSSGAVWDGVTAVLQSFDLTQMFGSAIADYIYSLEQATAGAGVSWFRKLFPAPYYAYNAGELISVKTSAHITRGFNQWDEEWEVGTIDPNTGGNKPGTSNIRSKNFIPVLSQTSYFFKAGTNYSILVFFYDINKNLIGYSYKNNIVDTIPNNCYFLRFNMGTDYGTTYNNDICINISKTTGTPKNGDYVAYDEHTYPLDSDLELRGVPKLENNKLVYDGDIYEASGAVTRRYGIVDLGTLDWTYAALSNNRSCFYTSGITDLKDETNTNAPINAVCTKYKAMTYNGTWNDGDMFYQSSTGKMFGVINNSYTDAASFKTAMSGVYLVYELATPTTETADPFTGTQVIDPDGTEEYVDSRTVAIPVGHESNYANICPIEGRTGTEVGRTGKNLLNNDTSLLEHLSYQTSAQESVLQKWGYEIHVPPGTYTIRGFYDEGTTIQNAYIFGGVFDSNNIRVQAANIIAADTLNTRTLTVAENQKIMYYDGSNDVKSDAVSIWGKVHVQLEKGSTATAYEPYSKDTASVTFGQTVYGCTHDFVSGKTLVTMRIVDLGELTWVYVVGTDFNVFRAVPNNIKPGSDFICERYPYVGKSSSLLTTDKTMANQAVESQRVIIRDDSYTDAASFKTAMSGVQLVYELATPIELDLTPSQLSLLQGANILTADGTINLTYLGSMASNVQSEIDEFENGLNNVIGSIAFIENQTAKTSHAVGEYVILNGIFCKVIAGISAGETLSFGTNIQATTIGAELKIIFNLLTSPSNNGEE